MSNLILWIKGLFQSREGQLTDTDEDFSSVDYYKNRIHEEFKENKPNKERLHSLMKTLDHECVLENETLRGEVRDVQLLVVKMLNTRKVFNPQALEEAVTAVVKTAESTANAKLLGLSYHSELYKAGRNALAQEIAKLLALYSFDNLKEYSDEELTAKVADVKQQMLDGTFMPIVFVGAEETKSVKHWQGVFKDAIGQLYADGPVFSTKQESDTVGVTQFNFSHSINITPSKETLNE